MNRKKSIILATALIMVLCTASIAYALTVGGYSQINTGIVTVTGKSTTTCDIYADYLGVGNLLYRDGRLVNEALREGSSLREITVSCGGSNQPGQQHWEVMGFHEAKHGGEQKLKTSYAETNY